MKALILTFSLLLDGVLSLYIPEETIFLPLLTITALFLICPLYSTKNNSYILASALLGFLYDQLYTSQLFLHTIIFIILATIARIVYNNFPQSLLHTIIYIIITIFIYELLMGTLLYIFQIVPVSFNRINYQFTHSLITNIIYGIILYKIIKLKEHKKKHN